MSEDPAPYAVEPVPDQPVAPTFGQILAALQSLYPNCFPPKGAERKALKIGIHKELAARGILEGVSKMQLRHFLHGYTQSFRYRKALAKGGSRVDLDGHPVGEVTDEQTAFAKESLKPKSRASRQAPAPRSQAATLNALPVDSPLTPENTVPGKLEVTIKFNELPKPVQVQGGYKFGLDCDGKPVVVILKPKHWNKLTAAVADFPQWIAALSGKMGEAQGKGFMLEQPSLQVFERKPKERQGADAGVEAPTADTTPPAAPSTPPAAPEPPRPSKPKLSLKPRG